jgi:hypothetical protein
VSATTERRPRSRDWVQGPRLPALQQRHSVWLRGRFRVISELSTLELPQGGGAVGPTWHVSIARHGRRRASDEEVRRILGDFGMREAEEDNHEPGVARHFFLPLDPAFRGICECKEADRVVVERDGHRWSTPHDAQECLGCKLAPLYGRPCSVHDQTAAAS